MHANWANTLVGGMWFPFSTTAGMRRSARCHWVARLGFGAAHGIEGGFVWPWRAGWCGLEWYRGIAIGYCTCIAMLGGFGGFLVRWVPWELKWKDGIFLMESEPLVSIVEVSEEDRMWRCYEYRFLYGRDDHGGLVRNAGMLHRHAGIRFSSTRSTRIRKAREWRYRYL